MTERERLVELIIESVRGCARNWAEVIADHLLANGVIVPPCKVGDAVYIVDGTTQTVWREVDKDTYEEAKNEIEKDAESEDAL